MTKSKIILIGGGGHCKAVIDVIEAEKKYIIEGIIDKPEKLGQKILGYKIIGNDKDIPRLIEKYNFFFITIGFIETPAIRKKLFEIAKEAGGYSPVIISSNAYVSQYSKIAEGTIIMHHSIINADSIIGKNCIINNKALIEHECAIGDNCHISTNTTINGNCKIEKECFIGSSSVLRNGISITSNTIIGSGSVVVKNISEEGIYFGNPAKKRS